MAEEPVSFGGRFSPAGRELGGYDPATRRVRGGAWAAASDSGACVAEPSPPPATLLQRVGVGDSAAVSECIARFGGLVWSLARRLSLSDAEAEDAVQDVFVEIWRNAHKYDPSIASDTAFVAMIARRRLIDRRRKLNRQLDDRALTDAVAADARAGGWRGSGGDESPRNERRSEVTEEAAKAAVALDQLSGDQQRVLRLSIYRGLPHELIARSLNMPLGTVKTHARRGLIRLREILAIERAATDAVAAPRGGAP